MRLIRKKGTWRTELAMKSSPPTSLSSHVIESKSTRKEQAHSIALTAIICEEVRSQSFYLSV